MGLGQVGQRVQAGWARLDAETLRDRVRGCLLAVACGDALGAAFEGQSVVSAGDYRALRDRAGVLRYTDDTAMILVLAEHLAGRLERDADLAEDELLTAFAQEWQGDPWRGYDAAPRVIFRAALLGESGRAAEGEMFNGAGSFGNGGARRVAPVALLGRPLRQVLQWARRSASLTDSHPLGQAGAALQAAAVSLAISSDRAASLDPMKVLECLEACDEHPAFTARLRRIPYLLDDERPGRAARSLGNGIAALESVPAAILAFLRNPDDPTAVIEFAIRLGGDTDTIAAMAGAMAGARCGEAALPAEWIQRVEHSSRILPLADMLTRAAASVPAPEQRATQ
jgi:poly(ADP-ribose) glycohydrolase ARH3